jgi:hypothetical protein
MSAGGFTLGATGVVSTRALGQSKKPVFLIVITCSGGASILDSVMAARESDVKNAGGDPASLNCFPDSQVTLASGSPFRAAKVDMAVPTLGNLPVKTDQSAFVKAHGQNMLAVTLTSTSVNHGVAQRRALTGNEALRGWSVQEAVAATYGDKFAVANLNAGTGGYGTETTDTSLPRYARQSTVADTRYWPLGLHGSDGLDVSADAALVAKARTLRDQVLDPQTAFFRLQKDNVRLQNWLRSRGETLLRYENEKLARKLFYLESAGSSSLTPDQETLRVREQFPNFAVDPLDGQAVTAYNAITKGISCAVTIGPSFNAVVLPGGINGIVNPPIGFDFSHTHNRGTQALMWNRVLTTVDKLIKLLKAKEFDAATGESYFDRTVIYFASDFGRSKVRPAGAEAFGTGHDLNNANLIISPLARGNTILGGIDYKTLLTYGFDPKTGTPDPKRTTTEKEFFTGLLQICDVDTSAIPGVTDMSIMKKKA